MLAERVLSTTELALNYAEGPDAGPPLLLLHGAADRWQSFLPILPALTMRWHVYAPDLRGHGLSGRTAGRYAIADYARDALVFLRDCIGVPAAIYGHSLGGMLSLLLAAEHPEWVRCLVVGDAILYREALDVFVSQAGHEKASRQAIIRAETDVPSIARALGELHPQQSADGRLFQARDMLSVDPDLLEIFTSPSPEYDGEALFPRIQCPVLLLQAKLMSEHDMARALRQLPHGYGLHLEGVGHGLHGEPGGHRVLLALLRFLEAFR